MRDNWLSHFSLEFILDLEKKVQQNPNFSPKEFFKLKNEFSARNKIPNLKNIDLVLGYREAIQSNLINKNKKLEQIISKRAIRSESWVAVVTCLTKPFPCPWKCIYCPSEPKMPKSYLSNQPASMRAVLNKFSPFNQVQNRISSLVVTWHDISKVELIIIWGTWSYLPKQYQTYFIKSCYDWLNQGIDIKNVSFNWDMFKIPKITRSQKSKTLKEAIQKNEGAESRCVWLTLETRPDFITVEEIKRLRTFGCTRVEIWVQSLFDDVQTLNKRWHTRAQTALATKLLKDAWFKISFHLMPGLLGSSIEKDIETVRLTFENDDFKPDLIKLYPCVVLPHSQLESIWRQWKFKPLSQEDLKPILIEMKKLCPRYCRITRLVRDIPSESILDWCKIINLRQIIQKEMHESNIQCQCIRCREIKANQINSATLNRLNFHSCWWDEIFLSFDDLKIDKIISLLRLRIPSQYFTKEKHFIKELEWCAIIREVHTYWIHTSIWVKDWNSQHYGFWKQMIAVAEQIAKKEYWLSQIAVIAWVWVREYYYKLWYRLVGTYMIKSL